MTKPARPIHILGAGLSGLAAALAAHRAGHDVTLLEAEPEVGGRVRSVVRDGFILDRGFQVLLTSYDEASRVLDFKALDLRTFAPGALVRLGARFARASDPWRDPASALDPSWLSVLPLADALRLVRLRAKALELARGGRPDPRLTHVPTAEFLRAAGFSPKAVDRFFVPFFGGVFLDRALSAPAPVFLRLFGRFATGLAALPAGGMGAIASQLAARLPARALRLGVRVRAVAPRAVTLDDGSVIAASDIIIATGGRAARRLLAASGQASAAAFDVAGAIDALEPWVIYLTRYGCVQERDGVVDPDDELTAADENEQAKEVLEHVRVVLAAAKSLRAAAAETSFQGDALVTHWRNVIRDTPAK